MATVNGNDVAAPSPSLLKNLDYIPFSKVESSLVAAAVAAAALNLPAPQNSFKGLVTAAYPGVMLPKLARDLFI